jgi:hypothetical protein
MYTIFIYLSIIDPPSPCPAHIIVVAQEFSLGVQYPGLMVREEVCQYSTMDELPTNLLVMIIIQRCQGVFVQLPLRNLSV